MKNLGSHDSNFGGDLAAAWGPTPGQGISVGANSSYIKEKSEDSSHGKRAPSDSARTVVADKLARMIHIGLLEAGDPLPSERMLCEVFGVARQSVRGGLGVLESRLMVAISHGRRSRILGSGRLCEVDYAEALKRLRARHASDVFQALLVVDAEIASLSAKNIKAQDLDRLDVMLTHLPDIAKDPLCYQMLDYEIRSLVYTSCGNSLLADIAMDAYAHASPQRRQLFADQQEVARSAALQVSLAKALRERDSRQVALILRTQVEGLGALHSQDDSETKAPPVLFDEPASQVIKDPALTIVAPHRPWVPTLESIES